MKFEPVIERIIFNPYVYTTKQLLKVVAGDGSGRCEFGVDFKHRMKEVKKHFNARIALEAIDRIDFEIKSYRCRLISLRDNRARYLSRLLRKNKGIFS